jgi:hypothetical protein
MFIDIKRNIVGLKISYSDIRLDIILTFYYYYSNIGRTQYQSNQISNVNIFFQICPMSTMCPCPCPCPCPRSVTMSMSIFIHIHIHIYVYRVGAVFRPLRQFFSKNVIEQSIFNIFMPNSQIMCTGTCKIKLYEENATRLHHSLNPVPELLADLGHSGPWEDGHHIYDLGRHQRGRCCGGLCLYPLCKKLQV